MASPLVQLRGITREYVVGDTTVRALRGIDLEITAGEMVAVMGSSGSGKSTLMNILGCLDRPTAGEYLIEDRLVSDHDDDALADLRNRHLGFVFQGFNLLPRTTALENVALPLMYSRRHRGSAAELLAREALERVGLADRLQHQPNELSGGQQQRVAIARALVASPELLLADEPTGNLDSRTTLDVMALFQDLHAHGVTLVIVTHERNVAEYCRRAVTLMDGRVVSDVRIEPRTAAEDRDRLAQGRTPAPTPGEVP